jgi:hypothetical protein
MRKSKLIYPGVSHLGFHSGAETPKLIYIPLNSFRGFASRDFAMCDDKRSRILVSREPKLRNSEAHIYMLSSFRGFASRDFAMCDDKRSCIGFPGSRNSET